MSASHSNREIEIKLRVRSVNGARRLLRRAGFRVVRRRGFESNTVFDTPELTLRGAGSLLRVRQERGAGLLTFKGPAAPGRHKSREEFETRLTAPEVAAEILQRVGLRPVFRYEKYRSEWARQGEPGLAMLDETPIGSFLELEGTPRWIDRTARSLGFSDDDYITLSYASLYLEYCRRRGVEPAHMVFPPGKGPGTKIKSRRPRGSTARHGGSPRG